MVIKVFDFANGFATYYLAENCVTNILCQWYCCVLFKSSKIMFELEIAQEVFNVKIDVVNNFKD